MDGFHSVAGPGCVMRSGPAIPQHCANFPAFAGNDNHARPRIAGVEAIELLLETDAGTPFARLQARLRDGSLILLLRTRHADDLIALWRGLGRDLNAALDVVDSEGNRVSFSHPPGALSFQRRRGSPLQNRRTRVSRRRQPPLLMADASVQRA